MNSWGVRVGAAEGRGVCLDPGARASRLPSNRAPGNGRRQVWAPGLVQLPKRLPLDPWRNHRPGGEVGAGGAPGGLCRQNPRSLRTWSGPEGRVQLHVAQPGKGSGLGVCPSIRALFRVSSAAIALKPFLLDSLSRELLLCHLK